MSKQELRVWLIDDSEQHWVTAESAEQAIDVYLEWNCFTRENFLNDTGYTLEELEVRLVPPEEWLTTPWREDDSVTVNGTLHDFFQREPCFDHPTFVGSTLA